MDGREDVDKAILGSLVQFLFFVSFCLLPTFISYIKKIYTTKEGLRTHPPTQEIYPQM